MVDIYLSYDWYTWSKLGLRSSLVMRLETQQVNGHSNSKTLIKV